MSENIPTPMLSDTMMDYGRRVIEANADEDDDIEAAVRLFGTYEMPGPFSTYRDHAKDALRALEETRRRNMS